MRRWSIDAQWSRAVFVIAVLVAATGLLVASPVSLGADAAPSLPTGGLVVLPCSGGSVSTFGFRQGTRVVSQTDSELCATGRVTVTFAGDRAAGCAGHGLCRYHGTETWSAAGAGELRVLTLERHGRRSVVASIAFGGFGKTDRSSVTRGAEGGDVCRDRVLPDGGSSSPKVRHGRVQIALGAPGLVVFGTRCAGPLPGDIASVLPRRTVSLAQLRRGDTHVDLGGSARFVAEGFSGTVTSTVELTIAKPRAEHFPTIPQPRLATARYRISGVAGTATASVQTAGVVCRALDACGQHGTFSIALGAADRTLELQAAGSHNPSKLDLLTALGVKAGGQTAGVGIFGLGLIGTPFSTKSVITQHDKSCSAAIPHERMIIRLQNHARRLRITASPYSSTATDPLRSRCPGPRLDLHPIASASLPLSTLQRPHFQIKLHGTTFHNGPYVIATHSSLTIALHRTAVTVTGPTRR